MSKRKPAETKQPPPTFRLIALCFGCATQHEAVWPGGQRPKYCPTCRVVKLLKWRFDTMRIDRRDVRELQEWFAR